MRSFSILERLGARSCYPAHMDTSTLAAVLENLRIQRDMLDRQIERVEGLMAGQEIAPAKSDAPKPARKKRVMSEAGRRAIALASKKRWAALRKAKKQESA